jgi:L-threonylcarbamoyladenylate synthase
MAEVTTNVDRAVRVLRDDGIVVYPTETLYGLGVNALSERAIRKIYGIKKRLLSEPISIAVSSYEMMKKVVYIQQIDLIKCLFEYSATVLLKKRDNVPDSLTAGSELIGVRLPRHPMAVQLVESFGSPITATSANISGEEAPKNVGEVMISADLILDGGGCRYGLPSTVVDLVNMKILRCGVNYEQIKDELKRHGLEHEHSSRDDSCP